VTVHAGGPTVTRAATPDDAPDVLALTRETFTAYADLQPQPSSLRETVDDVAADLAGPGGLVVREASADGEGPGRLLAVARFAEHDGGFWLRRVAVAPDARRPGLATGLAVAAEDVARERGHDELRVAVRTPLRDVADVWRRLGFHDVAERDYWVELARPLPVVLDVPTAEDMLALGRRLAAALRAGDLVVLSGDLGAGKTTLTRGIGEGLEVRGAVTSPTFVIARVHPPAVAAGDRPSLVHVDAYRLGDLAEVDDLDLDASLEESVTVVEWGEGMVEGLAASRLHVTLRRDADESDESRQVTVRGVGDRWSGVDVVATAPDRQGQAH
jgi:tRNA threonylcarbamoyladenosine biosynthesis protein TsaE